MNPVTRRPLSSGSIARLALLSLVLTLVTMAATALRSAHAVAAEPRAVLGVLDNGLQVVVIPDHRAPIVNHMVWYKVGGADEPPGESGIAHFLEHLMFKGTEQIPVGEFSKIIARNGGQDNAFTNNDVTAYYQSVARERLPLVMQMEADRMVNLRLDEKDVLTERDVILEERRMRVDNNPSSILSEQMMAALYLNHPYRIPVIGWQHEIAALSRANALAYYRRFYAPNNAILVVAGDVEPDEVMQLARDTYGKIPANPDVARAKRPTEPHAVAPRRVDLTDPRAGQPTFERDYQAPSYSTAKPGEAEAIDLLVKVLASGPTSRLYKALVVGERKAASVGGYFTSTGLDGARISLYAIAAPDATLEDVEASIDRVIAEVVRDGITEAELERAKRSYIADYVYEADSLTNLARRYGWGLATGQTIEDIEAWPDRIRAVTLEDIMKATAYLDVRDSVTGFLRPSPAAGAEATPASSGG
ncbi:MAG: pitrilysin family protein [Hyphomicrobiaceae bacterium]